jgi:hypothetical protein
MTSRRYAPRRSPVLVRLAPFQEALQSGHTCRHVVGGRAGSRSTYGRFKRGSLTPNLSSLTWGWTGIASSGEGRVFGGLGLRPGDMPGLVRTRIADTLLTRQLSSVAAKPPVPASTTVDFRRQQSLHVERPRRANVKPPYAHRGLEPVEPPEREAPFQLLTTCPTSAQPGVVLDEVSLGLTVVVRV